MIIVKMRKGDCANWFIRKLLAQEIDTRTVQVQMKENDPGVTRVVVLARTKNGGSDVELAAEIDKQIALQLPRY